VKRGRLMLSTEPDTICDRFVSPTLAKFSSYNEVLSGLISNRPQSVEENEIRHLNDRGKELLRKGEFIITYEALVWCLESLGVSYITTKKPDPLALHFTEQLMHRYEVDKQLAETYKRDTFKPSERQCYNKKEFELFSLVLLMAYFVTEDIRFLNTLLNLQFSLEEARALCLRIVGIL